MYETGEIIELRALPTSCNTCNKINTCRPFLADTMHLILYDDEVSVDIEGNFFKGVNSFNCIQGTLTVLKQDVRYPMYNNFSQKSGIYKVCYTNYSRHALENSDLTYEDIKDFLGKCAGKEFNVEFFELDTFNLNGEYNQDIYPVGSFVDKELHEEFLKYEYVVRLHFNSESSTSKSNKDDLKRTML